MKPNQHHQPHDCTTRDAMTIYHAVSVIPGVSVAEWLACWHQAQKGPGSNRSGDAVLGKLFTSIVPLFAKQQNW